MPPEPPASSSSLPPRPLASCDALDRLAQCLTLGALLDEVRARHGGYELLDHWQQGEFHHDVVVRVDDPGELPGQTLIVATNCNGGVKEALCFAEVPARGGLWRWRCPENTEFEGPLPTILARAETVHFFHPCELLEDTARSELREEHRTRQRGGGWTCKVSLRSTDDQSHAPTSTTETPPGIGCVNRSSSSGGFIFSSS